MNSRNILAVESTNTFNLQSSVTTQCAWSATTLQQLIHHMLLIFCLLLAIYSSFFVLDGTYSILANRCTSDFLIDLVESFIWENFFSDNSAYLLKADITNPHSIWANSNTTWLMEIWGRIRVSAVIKASEELENLSLFYLRMS